MKRKIIIYAVAALSLLMFLNSIAGLISTYEKRTEEKEIIWIHNIYELQNISKNLNGHYALANDIDASVTKNWNDGKGFVPIGSYYNPFNGIFDGNGHKIINLYIKWPLKNDVGLFGVISKYAIIDNVGLINVSVRGNWVVGGLVGDNEGTVSNSYAVGNMSGGEHVGGLVGNNWGTVSNSYSIGYVIGDHGVGGLVGWNLGTVENSYSTGNVSGSAYVGGLVGANGGTVSNSYSIGYVIGDHDVGGLVGDNEGTVENSYSTGNVSGSAYVGGLVGANGGTVSNSYVTGSVSGSDYVGGLVGDNYNGTVKNSHYNVDEMLINGGYFLTIGGIFDSQYNDWISHNLTLDISNYPSLVPDGEFYGIRDVQGIKDMLGFCEDGLKFKLIADIDLSSTLNLYIPYFDGVFDGNNHTILNLTVLIPFANHVALFGFNRGIIKDVSVLNITVIGNEFVGGLVGENRGIVNNSYSTGIIGGFLGVGGLVGLNGGTVSRSYSTGNVIEDIFDSFGSDGIGGLVGMNLGTVSNSYATGNVNVSWGVFVGGLVGANDGTVSNSYATGNVNGGVYVGGLVGANDGTVENSYSTGNVSGYDDVGGLIGRNRGTVTASFWDIYTSGIGHSDGGVGKTTEEMKNKTTFLNAGWDFINLWGIIDGQTYPYLLWSTAPRDLKAEAGAGFINLTWKAPANKDGAQITEYNIYRNDVKIATVSANQLWFNDTNVIYGQTYTYYVTAVNAAGESPKSNEVRATPEGSIPEIDICLFGTLAIVLLLARRK